MCQPTNAFDSTRVCRLGLLPRVIDREAELPALCEVITAAPWVALDTEADSLHAYPEKLCLIQISVPGRDELVDPLAGMDMCDFFSALNRHTLLMHGADYDVRLFKRGCDFVPNQIFDTMLAARLTGRMQFGLSALVNEFLGVELEKGSRKANWAAGRLRQMAEYAVNDTLHLRPLVDALQVNCGKKAARTGTGSVRVWLPTIPSSRNPTQISFGESRVPDCSRALIRGTGIGRRKKRTPQSAAVLYPFPRR